MRQWGKYTSSSAEQFICLNVRNDYTTDCGTPRIQKLVRNLRAKFVFSIGLLALLCLMTAGPLRADTWTYTYAGHDFSYMGGPGTKVTGFFTVSSPLASGATTPLAPDTIGSTIVIYNFADGYTTWDLANYVTDPGSQFSVTTNGSGDIVPLFLNITTVRLKVEQNQLVQISD